MERESICRCLRLIIVAELVATVIAWTVITNMHPFWMQLLAFPYLPIVDIITIGFWAACKYHGRR